MAHRVAWGVSLFIMSDYVLRIQFKGGRVSEERGPESSVDALFACDAYGLIDHVAGFDTTSGEVFIWTAIGDDRFDGVEHMTTAEIPRRPR